MKIESTPLDGCFIVKPNVFKDKRGFFCETFNQKTFKQVTGLSVNFVQDNQSVSSYGVLRGLHFQKGEMAQAKLVRVAQGKVLDVAVDLRKNSPTYGKHFSIVLDDSNNYQLFVPRGFAHGFAVLSKKVIFCYKCDNYYNKASEGGIVYNDATLNIDWHLPQEDIIVSEKDKQLPAFINRV